MTIKAGKHALTISNPDKVLYPAGRFTKRQVIDYYRRVSRFLLPHFKNRPITLLRYPDGVFGEYFYEKNAPGFTPGWVRTFPVPRTEGGQINYILLCDQATLLWAANLAALELHPFLHKVPALDSPTHIVFDLDPGEGVDIIGCAEVALLLQQLLQRLGLKSFPKVSGSKGLQIYVPLNQPVTYELTRAFARAVAEWLTRAHPGLVVSDMSKALRLGKVFVDWSQNSPTKTTVGAYSLRAKRERPLVSLPVRWQELRTALRTGQPDKLAFEPEAALARLAKLGDLFAPVLKLKQQLPPALVEALSPNPRSVPRSLAKYAARRNFTKSGEPQPSAPPRSAQGSRRRFVVQKHAAGHLHYDFRLEMHDVLKSWALPKGVPLLKGEQRSAFETEDHPLEYLDFEGIIPPGQYGGGTVMVWDIGTYEPLDGNYYVGELKVFLSGRKLKGEWSLRRLPSAQDKNKTTWLLIRTGPSAKPLPTSKADRSALTGRTLEQIANDKRAVWRSDRAVSNRRSKAPRGSTPALARSRPVQLEFVPPMRATLVSKLPEGPQWIYEVKWDGYRTLAAKNNGEVRLLSLHNKPLGQQFPSILGAVKELPAHAALLDGEVVAVDGEGRPSFQALQNRSSLGGDWHIVYYAFDLLNLDGKDLTSEALEQRRHKLQQLVRGTAVRFSAALPGAPQDIVREVKAVGLEGVLAKRKDSRYRRGTRSDAWQKFKLAKAQEFVLGGYNPDGPSFSSLLVGYYEGDRLLFAGKVRQGFNPASRAALFKALQRLRRKACPFANLPSSKTGHFGEGVTAEQMPALCWVRPDLVVQVSFTEWTNYGVLRHATFLGLREDKDPQEVVREDPR